MKIMIVEDHPGMRRMLRNMVSYTFASDVEFIEFSSGEHAVEQYVNYQPDCVLMDIELPEMNGFEAVEKIYSQDSRAFIVVVTSHDTASFRKRAMELPVKGFVVKENLHEICSILETIPTPKE
jgi:DNA-binding NarL/FixJ family response regulator